MEAVQISVHSDGKQYIAMMDDGSAVLGICHMEGIVVRSHGTTKIFRPKTNGFYDTMAAMERGPDTEEKPMCPAMEALFDCIADELLRQQSSNRNRTY